jgi:SpoVK/Ycf46/Vps4 family AAA+-type ATPase
MSNYKVKDLKVYTSDDWLANNQKNYRQVFDESEAHTIWVEFSFYNKQFDRQDWRLNCTLKVIGPNSRLYCTINANQTVYREDNIVYVRKFSRLGLKKGDYRWEVWLDGRFIKSKPFYIISEGVISSKNNHYFTSPKVKLFEGPSLPPLKEKRKYITVFENLSTRYVWFELEAQNLIKSGRWPCELFFNVFNQSNQLKMHIQKLIFVNPTYNQTISVSDGWGAEKAGTWYPGDYRLEVVFMNQIVAAIPFSVRDKSADGELDLDEILLSISDERGDFPLNAPEKNPALSKLLNDFDQMIGLDTIKARIRDYIDYLNFLRLRVEKGFKESDKINLHAVFTGNPGTGKTTVARLLANVYREIGLLSKGHLVEAVRGDLVAEYIGQTAPKTKKLIQTAENGILFIDEAYSLARKEDDFRDFGREAIEVLIKEMSDREGKFAVIVAGYPDEMEVFLNSNPGLKSRFHLYYDFPDYTPEELLQIALLAATKRSIDYPKKVEKYLYEKLVDAYRARDRSFGNARYAISVVNESKMNLALRLMKLPFPKNLSKEELSLVQQEDIEKVFKEKEGKVADIPINEDLLKKSLDELQELIGLENIKHDIKELVKLVRYYREIGKDVRRTFSLHSVFTGNPGTGKTTVARILANIYRALGILERGHLVECERQHLVAGYVGQTAEKTGDIIKKSLDGVLFIDEAYTLTSGGDKDFGKEVIEILLKRMEEERGRLVVILAGYTEQMKNLLESNPGIKSRFDYILHFEDYSESELMEIALFMLSQESLVPDVKALKHLKKFLSEIVSKKDPFFGNARTVRKIVDQILRNHDLRLAGLSPKKRTKEIKNKLSIGDVNKLRIDDIPTVNKPKIGFTED